LAGLPATLTGKFYIVLSLRLVRQKEDNNFSVSFQNPCVFTVGNKTATLIYATTMEILEGP
jgi:hypothetical protein